MEILRVPSSTFEYEITGLAPGEYSYILTDLADRSVTTEDFSIELVTDVVTVNIPSSIDGEYELSVLGDSSVFLTEQISVVRPYVDPNTLGTTASEIEEYKNLEMAARSIIDTIIVNGFYNQKYIVQRAADGSDYFSIWETVNKVLKVYENNTLIYDIDTPETNEFDFRVTLDNSAIERVIAETYNRSEQGVQQYPRAFGDLGHSAGSLAVGFPRGWDYTFVFDIGYKTVPSDVQYATKLLIEDIKCGKLDYYTRYVTSYNSDQFRIQFDKSMLEGTGNMIVDKILDKYQVTIPKPGII
jgi:hypothetical protein